MDRDRRQDYGKQQTMPPGTRHLVTKNLLDRLTQGKPGDVLTYEEADEIAERDCSSSGDGYGYMRTAMTACVRDRRLVWERDIGAKCYRCYTAAECLAREKGSTLKGIRGKAKRSSRKVVSFPLSDIPEAERGNHLAFAAQIGTITIMADTKTIQKLEARRVDKPLDLSKLLEAMTE